MEWSTKTKLEVLREKVQNVLDGNYPNPREYRPGKCKHDVYYYNSCERCVDEYLTIAMELTK